MCPSGHACVVNVGAGAVRRLPHCIDLITVRSRPVSGFISADQAGCRVQFLRFNSTGFANRYERKLGVSLFCLA